MNGLKKTAVQILLILVLLVSVPELSGISTYEIAEAATKVPATKVKTKKLYAGYSSYKITLNNTSTKATITYKSNNKKVATVNSGGTVKPIAAGEATITVTVKQNNITYPLKVKIRVVKPFIDLQDSIEYLNVDESYKFKAKAYGTKESIKWSVSDSKIASMSKAGRLTAKETGKVIITARAGSVKTTFEVIIGDNRLGTFTRDLSIYTQKTIYVNVYEQIEEEALIAGTLSGNYNTVSLQWEEPSEEGLFPLTIIPKKLGSEVVVISSDMTTDQLFLRITVTEKPKNRAELSAKKLYEETGPATVEIYTVYEGEDEGYSFGSGFFIDQGLVVTNYHVIEGASEIFVYTKDEKEYKVKEIVGLNVENDLVILRIDSKNHYLTLSQEGVTTGEDIYALGSPLGLSGTLSNGMVSTASRVIDGVDYIQITAPISQGNSGGPLLNVYGEVVGVNTMYMVSGQSLNFSLNINEIYKISTNRPITVKEYLAEYNKEMAIAMEREMGEYNTDFDLLEEDPELSSDPLTCQEIYPWLIVSGTMKAGDRDYYKFTIDKQTYIIGALMINTVKELEKIRFQVYDKSHELVIDGNVKEVESGLGIIFSIESISPGDYYIAVWMEGDSPVDIEYSFGIITDE